MLITGAPRIVEQELSDSGTGFQACGSFLNLYR